jgi:hypothetical protein
LAIERPPLLLRPTPKALREEELLQLLPALVLVARVLLAGFRRNG